MRRRLPLDGRTVGGGDIDAGVVAVTAENIPPAKVGGDPPPDGPGVASSGAVLGFSLVPTALTVVVGSRRVVEDRISRWVSLPFT